VLNVGIDEALDLQHLIRGDAQTPPMAAYVQRPRRNCKCGPRRCAPGDRPVPHQRTRREGHPSVPPRIHPLDSPEIVHGPQFESTRGRIGYPTKATELRLFDAGEYQSASLNSLPRRRPAVGQESGEQVRHVP